jgi:hypothetical protein
MSVSKSSTVSGCSELQQNKDQAHQGERQLDLGFTYQISSAPGSGWPAAAGLWSKHPRPWLAGDISVQSKQGGGAGSGAQVNF